MPRRKDIPEAIEVRNRFIRSFEELRYRGLVKTKGEFCREVGLSSTTSNYMKMINGKREPGISNILLLHRKYGVSIDWILFGRGEFLMP